jgi:hypothetical protein
MILPTKHLAAERSLLALGGAVLTVLGDEAKTISRTWDELRSQRGTDLAAPPYDWFILSLDLLFVVGAIEIDRGRLRRLVHS